MIHNSKFKILILFILISAFIFPNLKSFAQVNLEEVCQSMEKIEQACQTLSAVECRQLLEKCAKYYEEKSAQIEKDITKTEQEKKTLQNQIYILRNKIKNLEYQIYQSNVIIKDLGVQVKDTEVSIEKTSLKIEDSKNQLANILQLIYEEDQKSLIEILFSEADLSDFFDDLMALETLDSKNQELLENIKSLKTSLESEKQLLSEEKEDTERMVIIQQLQKQESEKTKKDQEYFLRLTEAEYQKHLKEKEEIEAKATAIRARIFELIGVPKAPTFGEALDIAKYVEKITGVRPALLLAVMTQESNIGKNVGQCYLKNPSTGEGVTVYNGKPVSRAMSPKRDVPYFLEITQKLGRDPYNTPVSCPMSVGWGGAMGPAQFIPDTWANPRYGYGQKVSEITEKPADPWNIKDAFLAAGLYLRDLGVKGNEFRAVMGYFSGSSWSKWEEFYGRSVLSIASQYEKDIREIEGLAKFSKPLTFLNTLF